MGKGVDPPGTRQPKVESHITSYVGSYAATQGLNARRQNQQMLMTQTRTAQTMTVEVSAHVGARSAYTKGPNEDGADNEVWGINR